MKKLLIAILLAALLVIPVPATALAAPSRAVFAEMDVWAVGGDPVTETVFYAGTVTDAVRQSKDWKKLEGATISAEEKVTYYPQPDEFGNIGTATGKITITGSDHAVAVMTFESDINWNAYGQLVDIGEWKTVSASGFLHILKDAKGGWEATINPSDFTGTAKVTGTY